MSIVAVSQTLGSLGEEIGRELARALSLDFADREVVLRAAERFAERLGDLQHVTEERPALWERFAETAQRDRTYVEAVVWELAARGDVVLVGRGAPFLLAGIRHVLRVRITAPSEVRAARVAQREGLTPEAAADAVRQSDRERAARIRFLYQVDWSDPGLYSLVLDTDGVAVADGARVVGEMLRAERFRPVAEGRQAVADAAVAAGARAALVAEPRTRRIWLSSLACRGGRLTLSGVVDREEQRELAGELAAKVPGVSAVVNDIVVAPSGVRGSRAAL